MTDPQVLAGRYRLDAELGHGAMGVVWDAYDEVLRRRVAIKQVMLPKGMPPGESEQIARRTLREARAVAALSHPHVITLYDILTLDTGPVIVMELMQARTLAEILAADGPLSDTAAAVVGLAVVDGLIAAHQTGITHRDVKPANVLIGHDGRIKLTDFGIARSVTEQTMTATGMVLGSPAYISPEVAAGKPAGPAADAWGLGALLYAAVEGQPPYDKGAPIATMTAVVSDPVPAHPHAGRIGPLIDGLLVKEPYGRMPLAEVRRVLAGIAGTQTLGSLGVVGGGAGVDAGAGGGAGAEVAGDQSTGAHSASGGPGTAEPPSVSGRPLLPSRPDIPPPPWAGIDSADLPALPSVSSATHRGAVLLLALIVCVVAAGAGYFGVLFIAGLAR